MYNLFRYTLLHLLHLWVKTLMTLHVRLVFPHISVSLLIDCIENTYASAYVSVTKH